MYVCMYVVSKNMYIHICDVYNITYMKVHVLPNFNSATSSSLHPTSVLQWCWEV